MLCEICKKEILYDIGFNDLSIFKYICKNCHKVINEKYEVIPLDYGFLLYNYYFINEEDFTKELVDLIYEKMIKLILKKRKSIIIFDDEEIRPFLSILNFKKDITYLSIFKVDLYDYFIDDELEL